uniref:C3/C5 convertase n=1 Tax=Cyprinus carpio TaxID=7962 RepID=A0A8C2I9I2_CYPCA
MEREPWLNLFLLAILCPLITGAPSSISCPDENLRISGGSFAFSEDGSTVRYSCSEGYYPTIKIRLCIKGRWNPLPKIKPPECKKITCPDPRSFENGEVYPYQRQYFVNDTTHYSCNSGYDFRGSGTRVCQLNWKWSGGTPVCGRNSDYCPDPGIPAGCTRTGHRFNIDDKVTYHCENKWSLIGSKERVCQENGQWSGTEPQCYADFTYDSPEEASEGFSSSLKSNLAVSQQHEGTDQHGKKIQVTKGGKLDIYIALDVSNSIKEDDFQKAKGVIKTLIEKVYEIVCKGDRSGTNIALAYKSILESMQIEQLSKKEDFKQTQHIVIMFTDGQANMGGNPRPWVDQIKALVKQNAPSEEENLELYVFGVGDTVNAESINDLKTDRGNEKFFFKLKSLDALQKTFDEMIVLSLMLLQRSSGKISNCMGSLVTSSFILTAAHCFRFEDTPDRITVDLGSDIKVKDYIPHPRYDVAAKKKMGIPEYYEFDVALIQLKEPCVCLYRPICIPCTKETSGALKLSDREGTCKKHQEELMSAETVKASFMSVVEKSIEKKQITIKQGKWRDACVEDAKKAKGINATNAKDIVTDNFLCSGGIVPTVDDVACKGDSGGATFVVPGNRLVQVGIVSWGVEDLCKDTRKPKPDSHTRDYHTNLFSAEVREFLKRYLEDEKLGTPLKFL